MDTKEEERRWNAVIEQYKSDMGLATVGINTNIGKGYLLKDESGISLTEQGIGYIQGTLDAKGITEAMLDNSPITKELINLFSATDDELDVMACRYRYMSEYKCEPNEESVAILKKLLTTANIPKSE